jgi:hypothetical protein
MLMRKSGAEEKKGLPSRFASEPSFQVGSEEIRRVDRTCFSRAASERAVFICVTEHTRNVDGTTLSINRTEGSLF